MFPKCQGKKWHPFKENNHHGPHPPSTESTSTIHFLYISSYPIRRPQTTTTQKKTTYIHQFTDLYVFLGGHFRNLPLLPPNRLSQEHDSSTTGTTPRLLWLIRTQAGRSADNWSLAVFQRTPGVSLFQDAPGSWNIHFKWLFQLDAKHPLWKRDVSGSRRLNLWISFSCNPAWYFLTQQSAKMFPIFAVWQSHLEYPFSLLVSTKFQDFSAGKIPSFYNIPGVPGQNS